MGDVMPTSALALFLQNLVSGSLICRALRSAAETVRRAARASSVCAFVSRPERLTSVFYQSFFGRLAAAVPDACTQALRRSGAFLERVIPGSFTLWALKWLGERFFLFFCLFVAAHALVPFALYRNPYTVAAMAFFAVGFASHLAFSREPQGGKKRADPVFLLYFFSIAASAVYSLFGAGAGMASTTTAVLYLTAILFAALIANAFCDRARLLLLIRVIVFATVAVALYGVWQYLRGIPIDVTQTDQTTGGASLAMGRADSTLGNPNVLASWLILVIPFSVSLFFTAKGFRKKLLLFLAALLMLACLFLTQSRSGWIGFAVAAITYVFLLDWRLVPLFAAAALLSFPFWPDFIMDRLLTLGSDTSSVYRYTIYAGAFRMALTNWATGIGIGLEFFKRYINNYVYFAYGTAPVHSHMLPLQIWLESGIVALASFLWFLARLIKKAAAYISFQKSHTAPLYNRPGPGNTAYNTRLILTACLSAVTGFLAMGFFEYVWFFPRGMNHFFMIVGIFICAVNLAAPHGAGQPYGGAAKPERHKVASGVSNKPKN
ncbi:MAG: O-antigen ligase family protein [Clostridiales bacterium]|jgi:O-antigen ligase|nr:O-antigen ligase family protein [Clostridiales bacterium]